MKSVQLELLTSVLQYIPRLNVMLDFISMKYLLYSNEAIFEDE